MPSFTTYVPLKEVDNITLENDTTNGLQVKNQGISSTQLGDLEKWELLETLTLTGAVHTSATLTAKKQYKIVLEQIQGSAATTDIFLQMNEDTGNNYSYRYASGSGIGNAGAQAGILLMRAGNTALSCAEAQIEGKTHASGGMIHITGTVSSNINNMLIGGRWTGANDTQISKISVSSVATGNLTGIAKIYGCD